MSAPTALVRYDAARRALAEAVRFDDVKQIRDLAVAAQAYARQANDPELIDNATDIRKRAEIRGGEVLVEMREQGQRASNEDNLLRGNSALPREVSKLSDLGITKIDLRPELRQMAVPL